MIDKAQTREYCQRLASRLEGRPHWPELRAVYLDLVTVVGQLQGAVAECVRDHGRSDEATQAELALDRLKVAVRQVGLDIRLASESALLIGLQTSLESAFETLDWLQRIDLDPT